MKSKYEDILEKMSLMGYTDVPGGFVPVQGPGGFVPVQGPGGMFTQGPIQGSVPVPTQRYNLRRNPQREQYQQQQQQRQQVAQQPLSLQQQTGAFPSAGTFLGQIYATSGKGGLARKEIEEIKPEHQCLEYLTPPQPGTAVCWLCGFPISQMDRLLTIDSSLRYSTFLDSAVCEHVLPVRLALIMTGLASRTGVGGAIQGHIGSLHSEYEWAHHYCNMVKSNQFFISKLSEADNWCDLVVNREKITQFLTALYYNERHPIGRPPVDYSGRVDREESGIFTATPTGTLNKVANNIVHGYVQLNSRYIQIRDKDGNMINNQNDWLNAQAAKMAAKCQRLIDHIKNADNCSAGGGAIFEQSMMIAGALSQGTQYVVQGPAMQPAAVRAPSFQVMNPVPAAPAPPPGGTIPGFFFQIPGGPRLFGGRKQRKNRKITRRRKNSKRKAKRTRAQRRLKGGGLTSIPTGAVVNMRLDPKDPYSIPITVGKEQAEDIIEDTTY